MVKKQIVYESNNKHFFSSHINMFFFRFYGYIPENYFKKYISKFTRLIWESQINMGIKQILIK